MVTKDSGYLGQIRSLGGRYGKYGQGLEFNTGGGTAAALLSTTLVLPSNPMRVYAWVQNVGAVELVIGFNDQSTTLYLSPWDTLLINHDFPWTGAITASGNGAECLFYWGEAYIAGV